MRTRRISKQDKSNKSKSIPLGLLVGGVVVLAVGIVATLCHSVDSLQENSQKLHQYQVKPTTLADWHKSVDFDFADSIFDSADRHDIHIQSRKFLKAAENSINRHEYRKAIDTLNQGLAQYEREESQHRASPPSDPENKSSPVALEGLMDKAEANGHPSSNEVQGDWTALDGILRRITYCWVQLGDIKAASKSADFAVKRIPISYGVYDDRGRLYSMLGKSDLARKDFETSKQLKAKLENGFRRAAEIFQAPDYH